MRRLTLILSDLYLPEEAERGMAVPTTRHLPNLEWLLRFASRPSVSVTGGMALEKRFRCQVLRSPRSRPRTMAATCATWLALPWLSKRGSIMCGCWIEAFASQRVGTCSCREFARVWPAYVLQMAANALSLWIAHTGEPRIPRELGMKSVLRRLDATPVKCVGFGGNRNAVHGATFNAERARVGKQRIRVVVVGR
jgi:hypothetical protein